MELWACVTLLRRLGRLLGVLISPLLVAVVVRWNFKPRKKIPTVGRVSLQHMRRAPHDQPTGASTHWPGPLVEEFAGDLREPLGGMRGIAAEP